MKELKRIILVMAGNTIAAFGIGGFIIKADLMMGARQALVLPSVIIPIYRWPRQWES
ncbi:hypothetical protein [Clostridium sp. AM58-1XD]|uniref:hypothetical protein n=1 Tax=Clostridium sp. AM58-1XD TaxID=2292307 RepID=UPI0026A892DC